MDDGKDGLDYRSNCGEGLSTSRERSKQSWAQGIVSIEAGRRVGREGKRSTTSGGIGTGVVIKEIDS